MLKNLLNATRRAPKEVAKNKPSVASAAAAPEKSARSISRNARSKENRESAERAELLGGPRGVNVTKLRIQKPEHANNAKNENNPRSKVKDIELLYRDFMRRPSEYQQQLSRNPLSYIDYFEDSPYEFQYLIEPTMLRSRGKLYYAIAPTDPPKTFDNRSVKEWIDLSTEEPDTFTEIVGKIWKKEDKFIRYLSFLSSNRLIPVWDSNTRYHLRQRE